MQYAIIRDGIVENVAEWDGESPWTPPDGTTLQSLEGSTAGPGWSFDGEQFTPPVQLPSAKRVTREEFVFGVLTADERAAIRSSQIPQVQDLKDLLLSMRESVVWDSPEFLGAMQLLEAVGIMSAERVQQILEPA